MNEIPRIQNWARWARENSRSIGHCASIEHRYKSPQCWYPEEAKIPFDLLDAVLVEKAVRSLPVEYQKPFSLYWVVYGGRGSGFKEGVDYAIIRTLSKRYKIGVNRNSLWDRIIETQLMVRNVLTHTFKCVS